MATHVPTSLIQLFDDNGEVLNGGSVTVYADETTTLLDLFTADDLTGAAANPIVLDSAGRHAMRYFANQSFKLLVKNASGGTIFTRDNIDPNIPIGTGILGIANGGTGASTSGTALSNLGGATAAELADLSADVAALAGSLGGTDATHIASGTTAQRKVNPTDGDIRNNTTEPGLERYDSGNAAWFMVADTDNIWNHITTWGSVKVDQEAATSDVFIVTPLYQQFHPSAAKAWGVFAGATGTSTATYNCSTVRDSAGDYTVTIANDFSSANYVITISYLHATTTHFWRITAQAAGSFSFKMTDTSNVDSDPTVISFSCFGTLA